jgi:hypothetical protein
MIKYFWMFLAFAAVAWYTLVTAYVAVKGVADIREMLRRLSRKNEDPQTG